MSVLITGEPPLRQPRRLPQLQPQLRTHCSSQPARLPSTRVTVSSTFVDPWNLGSLEGTSGLWTTDFKSDLGALIFKSEIGPFDHPLFF